MMTKLQFSDLRDIKRGRGRGGWLAESFTVMGSLPVSFMLESRTFISQKDLGISTASAACPPNRHVLSTKCWLCSGVLGSPLLVELMNIADMELLGVKNPEGKGDLLAFHPSGHGGLCSVMVQAEKSRLSVSFHLKL